MTPATRAQLRAAAATLESIGAAVLRVAAEIRRLIGDVT